MINPGWEDDMERYNGEDNVINDWCNFEFRHIVLGLGLFRPEFELIGLDVVVIGHTLKPSIVGSPKHMI